jgi:O-antigen ligase
VPRSPRGLGRQVLGWTFVVALGLAPLIFGGNVPLAWGINGVVFGSLLAASFTPLGDGPIPLIIALRRTWLPVLLIGCVLTWAFLQTAAWTPHALHHPIWDRASDLLGEPLPGAISVNPSETRLSLLRLATASAVFLVALRLGGDPIWAKRIVAGVAAAGTLHTLYALSLAAAGPDAAEILSEALFKIDQVPYLTGTFINRNHLAIYLGLAIISCWGLLVRAIRKSMKDHGFLDTREFIARGLGVTSALARFAVLFVPLSSGLLLTASRAAFLLTFFAILLLVFLERKRASRSLASCVALAVALVGGVFALTMQGDFLTAKLVGSSVESDIDARLAVARITAKAIADRPILGWGFGTFANVFPLYRDETLPLPGRWLEAHNCYLEALLGLGIPIAMLLFVALFLLAIACVRGALTRRRDQLAPSVAVGATLLIGAHALVDFSIQLQGIAVTYAALVGAGTAQSWSSRTL